MTLPEFLNPEKIIPISRSTTLIFKTGSWSNKLPLYQEKASPCREACPIGNNIPVALFHASQGDMDGALAAFLEENPLPGVCGHVCYHPCEVRCNRGQWDDALQIRAIERAASEYGSVVPEIISREGANYPVAVIGSGPAGLSCSYHLVRLGHPVTVFEREDAPGGLMRYGIPSYRLPIDVLERDLQRIFSLGIEIQTGVAANKTFIEGLLEKYHAVFIALGAHQGLMPELPGVDLKGVMVGLDFLKEVKRNQRQDIKGKVLVIGGGNVAIDVAMTAKRLGAEVVELVCLETRDEMPAHEKDRQDALEEGVIFRNGWGPKRILGKGDRVSGVEFVRCVSLFDTHGSFNPVFEEKETFYRDAEVVIFAIGQRPDLERYQLKELIQEADKEDILIHHDPEKTSMSRLFGGGEMIHFPSSVAEAIAAGKNAALSIHLTLTGLETNERKRKILIGAGPSFSINESYRPAPHRDLGQVVTFQDVDSVFLDHQPSVPIPRLAPEKRGDNFERIEKTLAKETTLKEAKRCFVCGICTGCDRCFIYCPDVCISPPKNSEACYEADEAYCKGCGVCVSVCPRGIITMGDKG
ncbi:MAG: FAD-dependent oxidoreductase [Deltaproteobacteria bacterium]|nr:FAD-dependent oxidoreductase [Deltaproteobacteria bacterium]